MLCLLRKTLCFTRYSRKYMLYVTRKTNNYLIQNIPQKTFACDKKIVSLQIHLKHHQHHTQALSISVLIESLIRDNPHPFYFSFFFFFLFFLVIRSINFEESAKFLQSYTLMKFVWLKGVDYEWQWNKVLTTYEVFIYIYILMWAWSTII